jgi:small subunit ribosomal protein S17
MSSSLARKAIGHAFSVVARQRSFASASAINCSFTGGLFSAARHSNLNATSLNYKAFSTVSNVSSSSSSSSSSGVSSVEANQGLAAEYAAEVADVVLAEAERVKRRQSLVGIISSTKNAKSITVVVQHQKFFPKYNSHIKRRKKIMAHDEAELGNVGDVVRIVPCRPMSKMKRHALIDVIRKAPV